MRHSRRALVALGLALGMSSPAVVATQSPPSVEQVLEVAGLAWTAQRHAEALAAYEEVVRRDSSSGIAVFRLAMLLAWRNDLDRAIDLLGHYRLLVPSDDDGRVALGRILAWRGRYDESIALYDSVLATNPRHREAALGAAQAFAWRGDLERAVIRYEQWLSATPADADALAALGQVLRWSGRPGAARQALRRALQAQPDHADAVGQLRWVDAALAPSLEPAMIYTNDSDQNRSTTYAVESGLPAPWSARLLVGARYRTADLATKRGTSLTIRTASSWAPRSGSWSARGEVGATRLEGRDAPGASRLSRIEPLIAARVSGTIAGRLALGAGATRAAFDETAALILSRIATTTVEGDAELSLHPHLMLSAGGSLANLTGGSTPNSRTAVSGALRWTFGRSVSAAVGGRMFSHERAASDGYFAPKRYLLTEGSVRIGLGGELGWALDGEVGIGHQTIRGFDETSAGRLAQRASGALVYRPTPGMEWKVGGAFANVASPATISSAEYRAWSFSLRGRVGL